MEGWILTRTWTFYWSDGVMDPTQSLDLNGSDGEMNPNQNPDPKGSDGGMDPKNKSSRSDLNEEAGCSEWLPKWGKGKK